MASGANVLILDEPTNHLDLDAREALEDASAAFDGAVLLVSHDRALLDAVGTRTVALEDGRLRSYEGGWAEYSRVREERRQAEAEARGEPQRASGAQAPAGERPARKSAGPSKNQLRRIADLERKVERAETALAAIEDELADPSPVAQPHEPGALHRAPRRGEASRREGLRGLGRGDPLASRAGSGARAVMR